VPATRKRCTKHTPSSKTECGHLNGGKSKAVTYAFPPGYRENAEEEEDFKMITKPFAVWVVYLKILTKPFAVWVV
jgi:hypothetical protein